jgi:AraC-like DNA-binding protein
VPGQVIAVNKPMDDYARAIHTIDAECFPVRHRTRRVQAARRFIDRRYDREIDLSDIAARACMSRHHFIREFVRHYGQTPWQYLRSVRIRRAGELLVQGRCVTEACLTVGYTSLASFSLLFTRMTGTAPSLYRKAILDKRDQSRLPIIDRWIVARKSKV